MRKAPQTLALFFIAITIGRVATFISLGLDVGFTGWLFSIGLAFGVYVSAFFIRHKESRYAAGLSLVFFVLTDLWFNEFELIRVLSSTQIVTPDSNFLGVGHEYLKYSMQFSALVFGAFPTIAAALLGWLQAGADRVAVLKSRRVLPPFFVAIATRFGSWFPEMADHAAGNNNNAMLASQNMPLLDGQVTEVAGPKRWHELTVADVAFISANGRGQVMARFGISDGSAGNWKKRIADGEKPWQVAKKLPENAEK